MRRRLFLSAICIILLLQLISSNTWATVWAPISNIDPNTTETDWFPQPAVTPDGTAWVVWHSYDPIEKDKEVFYSRWNGSSWEPRKTVNPPNTTPDDVPRISSAPNGTLWVLWRAIGTEGSGYLGLASRWLGTEWSRPDTVWRDGGRYDNFDLAAASATEAWFIKESVGDIIVYHHAGGARDTTRFDLPSASGYQPTIAHDAAGTAWAAWTHQETYPIPERLEFSRRVAGVWTLPEIIPLPTETKLPRLTVDKDDAKWIVCAGDDPANTYKGDDIWALRWNGTSWNPPTRISDPIQSNDSLQVYNSVSRTPGEYPRAVWVRANLRNYTRYDVLTTAWDGSTWSPVEVVGSLADSTYVNWPDVAVRGSFAWVTWMAEPKSPPYVLNILSTHSIPGTTSVSSVEFGAEAIPGGIRLSWAKELGAEIDRMVIYRASAASNLPEPPANSRVVYQIPFERSRAGSTIDRSISRASYYSYWLQISIQSGGVAWVGPRTVFSSALPPRSRLVSAGPNPSGGGIALRGLLGIDQPLAVNIYGVDGRLVRILKLTASDFATTSDGEFTVRWDGQSTDGASQPNGVYFVRLFVRGPKTQEGVLKIVLVR